VSLTQLFLDWAEDNIRLFRILALLAPIGSFLFGAAGTHLWHMWRARKYRKDYRKLENPDVLVVEGHYLREQNDGSTILLEIEAWGKQHPLSVFNDPVLATGLEAQARRCSGFIRLDEQGQYLLRCGLRDLITGNDWASNHAALAGRPVHKSSAIICPVTWPPSGVRDVHLVRVMVIDEGWVERLADRCIIDRIVVADPHYQYRVEWLHNIALNWPTESKLPLNRACMWKITLRSIGNLPPLHPESQSDLLGLPRLS
jgi:hypothetical protein